MAMEKVDLSFCVYMSAMLPEIAPRIIRCKLIGVARFFELTMFNYVIVM